VDYLVVGCPRPVTTRGNQPLQLDARRAIMDLADFLINVHPELPMDERTQLEDEICHMEGVVSACFSPNPPI
jgi:hypothetical protein